MKLSKLDKLRIRRAKLAAKFEKYELWSDTPHGRWHDYKDKAIALVGMVAELDEKIRILKEKENVLSSN